MQRRSFLFLTSMLSLEIATSFPPRAWAFDSSQPMDSRDEARRLNQLAASITTPADATMPVDYVVGLFPESLPSAWVSNSMRKGIAGAEFAAVMDPRKLIPEVRIAQAWNSYASAVAASPDRRVTATEVHNLRDALLTAANLDWAQGRQTNWSTPAIYANQQDGTIAPGARPIETTRILWDLSRFPQICSLRVCA